MKNIYDEIVVDSIINIKNPQYESEYYQKYWNNFLPDFLKKINNFYLMPALVDNFKIKEVIIENTNFNNTICVIFTLHKFWNSSKKYGDRYISILKNKIYSKKEIISLQINYNLLLKSNILKIKI